MTYTQEQQDAVRSLLLAENAIHRTYGSTSTCHGGAGGQTLTAHCAYTCHNPVHEADLESVHEARRNAMILFGLY